MDEKPLEKFLGEYFEINLRKFLSTSLTDRLDEAKKLFRWRDKELLAVFEKYSQFISEDLITKSVEEQEFYLKNINENLEAYINQEFQFISYYLPYFLWASHLIFDRTYSQLTYDSKEELRNYSNLNTPKKRKDAFTNFFSRFVNEKVKDGGSETFWDEWTRLYFLSLYERFSIVIENARKEIKTLRQKKFAVMEIKKEILNKFHIPAEYWNDLSKPKQVTKAKLARKWASQRMQKEFGKYVSKMGFADSFLIKILGLAREDAENHISCCRNYSNHKLFYLNWGDSNLFKISSKYKKEILNELKFDSTFKNEHPGMKLHFVNGCSILN